MEWRRYVPVAARRAKARGEMNKLRKKGKDIQPVEIEGRTIARSFWGKRWCEHLESFSDYANRLPRGRTYVRNGSVCHLAIQTGRIDAIVSGSELYDVTIRIDKLKAVVWKSVKTRCSGQIGSMLELLQGKLSQQVMGVVTDRDRGLFPKPGEIKLDCSCPDWATMCKHVASVLYGVGSRLDDRPESLFVLRGVDTAELIATEMALPGDAATDGALADDSLAGIFGIDLDTGIDSDIKFGDAPPPAPKTQAKPRKQARRRAASAPGRQAPPVVKARDLPVSTASAERPPRKAASGAARGKKGSPTVAPRKQAAEKAQELPVSTASAGRPRKAASGAARGKKMSPTAVPRKQAAAKSEDLPATKAPTERTRKTASNAARSKTPSPAPTPRKRTAAKARNAPATNAAASPRDIRPTGKWVAQLRRRSGLSVARFAGELGVSAVSVYRWEAIPGPLDLHARPLNALLALYRQFGKSGRRG